MEVSSNYQILFQQPVVAKTDLERESRFYRKSLKNLKQHAFQFHIWKYSVFSKFTIEALLLLVYIMIMLFVKWELAQEYKTFSNTFDTRSFEKFIDIEQFHNITGIKELP